MEMDGLGLIGYVANSTNTVIGESYSARRLYDLISKKVMGKACIVMPKGRVLCKIKVDKK